MIMKNFTDKIRCKNCNSEFYKEITNRDDCMDNSKNHYINCDYCNEKIYLHKKIYKIKLTCEEVFSKIEAISKHYAIMKFIKKEEKKLSSFFNETTIIALKNSIIIKE